MYYFMFHKLFEAYLAYTLAISAIATSKGLALNEIYASRGKRTKRAAWTSAEHLRLNTCRGENKTISLLVKLGLCQTLRDDYPEA